MYKMFFFPVFDMSLSARNKKNKFWRPLNELFPDHISSSKKIHDHFIISHYYANKKIQYNLKDFLGMGSADVLFIDSGGYQAKSNKIKMGICETLQVLHYQEKNGANIAATLDYPFDFNNTSVWEGWRRIKISIKNAILALENRENNTMKLYATIQGWDVLSYKKVSSILSEYNFDGYAIGLPNVECSTLLTDAYMLKITKILYEIKQSVGEKPLHVFGLSTIPIMYLFGLLGIDSFDSLKYLHAAKFREYFLPNGKKAYIGYKNKFRRIKELPCNCPVCDNVEIGYLAENGSEQGALLSCHNLISMLNHVKLINSAINEGWYDEIVFEAITIYPTLKNSVEWLKKMNI